MDVRVSSPKPDHEPLINKQHNEEHAVDDEDVRADVLNEDPYTAATTGDDTVADDQKTRSTLYIVLLTLGIGGLQLAWTVELASVSPFLLSLGLSKSLLALIWVAGPLGGTLTQPYVGIRSDNCRIRWGRRRPFILGGALATAFALMALAWTKTIIGGVFGIFGAEPDSKAVVIGSQIWAVLMAWVIDFVINIIQAGIRAFMVDCAPTHQQEDANAWASRLTGVGNIFGYLAGFGHLPKILPFLGNTQFRALCALASIGMIATSLISCLSIKEKDPSVYGEPSREGFGVLSFFKSMYHTIRNLPVQIKRVCQAQLFAWVAWFPFLFYTSTFVAEIYANPFFKANPNLSKAEIDDIWEQGTRAGSFTLFVFAITTFVASIVLPLLVVPTYENPVKRRAQNNDGVEHPEPGSKGASTPSLWSRLRRVGRVFSLSRLRIPFLTLRRAWMFSHVLFAVLMWCTLFVRTTAGATALISAIGIPWAMTNWAPYALIAAEASRRDIPALQEQQSHQPVRTEEDPGDDAEIEADVDPDVEAAPAKKHQQQAQAGVLLGIHNVSISAPQLIATLVSSGIFKALQKPRGQPDDDSVGWVFRFAGVCALGAAWMVRYVGEGEAFMARRAERKRRKLGRASSAGPDGLTTGPAPGVDAARLYDGAPPPAGARKSASDYDTSGHSDEEEGGSTATPTGPGARSGGYAAVGSAASVWRDEGDAREHEQVHVLGDLEDEDEDEDEDERVTRPHELL